MADGVWKGVYPQVLGRFRQLSLNKFFDPSAPSMKKGRDGLKKKLEPQHNLKISVVGGQNCDNTGSKNQTDLNSDYTVHFYCSRNICTRRHSVNVSGFQCSDQKTYLAKVAQNAQKPRGKHISRPVGHFGAPWRPYWILQAVSECPLCRQAGI